MSIALIVSLLDEEIARLEEAREILANYVEPPLEATSPSHANAATDGAPPEATASITVLPPRVRRSRSTRANATADAPSALQSQVPTGAVAVSATEAARKRLRPAPVAESAPIRWTARMHRTPTIDDLFGTTDPLIPPAQEPALGAPAKVSAPESSTPPPR